MTMLKFKFGDMALANLLVSLMSGLFVAYQYDYTAAYSSVITMDNSLPYGAFLRSLHYYSSQAFFLFLLIHIGEYICRGVHLNMPVCSWIKLVLTIPGTILLLFTGYILKGDIVGVSAGRIAEQLVLIIPFIGDALNRFFFSLKHDGLYRVYFNHALVLGLLCGWALWSHLKKRTIKGHYVLLCLFILFGICFFCKAPLDAPPNDAEAMLVKGPWFFLGVQELLRYFSPLWAGIVYPSIIIVLLLLLPAASKKYNGFLLSAIMLFMISHTFLTVVAFLR